MILASSCGEPCVPNRIVRFRTWADREFRNDYKRLPRKERELCEERLEALIAALASCNHPALDPELWKYRPSSYRVRRKGEGRLLEYRLPGVLRVIVCYFEEESVILLVAVTLTHDHTRLRRLIERNQTDFAPVLADEGKNEDATAEESPDSVEKPPNPQPSESLEPDRVEEAAAQTPRSASRW